VRHQDLVTDAQICRFQPLGDNIHGRADRAGRFKNDQVTAPYEWHDALRRLPDILQIGFVASLERRGDSDDEDVGFIGRQGRSEISRLNGRLEKNVEIRLADVGVALVYRVNDAFGDVYADDLISLGSEQRRRRQANVPETEYANAPVLLTHAFSCHTPLSLRSQLAVIKTGRATSDFPVAPLASSVGW